jgi:hypothetical protein
LAVEKNCCCDSDNHRTREPGGVRREAAVATGTLFDLGLFLEFEAQIAAIRDGNLDQTVSKLTRHVQSLSAVFF